MDPYVSLWVIIDFLLRQPLDDWTLDKIIRGLPLSILDFDLKKVMLVRTIASEISKGMASEKMLLLMELIEELDSQAGVTASEAIKAAYCDVAVDCTVRLLEESQYREAKYSNAVERIWRRRVAKMGIAENVGLVSDALLNWMDDIEDSVWDASVYEDLLKKKWRGCEALKSVRVYVAEAWATMGPSITEKVVQTVGSEQIKEMLKDSICPVNDQDQHLNPIKVQSTSAEMEKRSILPRRKHVITRLGRGAKISDSDSKDGRAASENGFSFTPEVNKMQEDLRASCKDLQAVVNDPLPEAILLADKVISSLPGNNLNPSCPMDIENLSAAKSDGALVLYETQNNDNDSPYIDNKKPCLMEKNATARVYEWDDSIDGSSSGNGLPLSTLSTRRVPPLKMLEMKIFGRRKYKRWSTVEEDTLRTGVEKYGRGNWKLILNMYRDIFEERTEVDLKDKWRNMTRF